MTTLLTHEWLRTRSLLLTVAGLAALVAAAGALLAATGWAVLAGIGAVVAVGAAICLVPAVQVALAVDYWRSSYGRVGYYTQTLPLRGATIYRAKLLWAWAASVAAVVATGALLAATWPAVARGTGMPERNPFVLVADTWAAATGAAGTGPVLLLLAVALALVLVWPVQYFFAASFGSETPRNRLGAGGPVVTWVVLYLVVQLVTVVGLFAVPYAVGPVGADGLGVVPFHAWRELRAGTGSQDVFPLGVVPPLLLVGVACAWRTVRSWDRKVSLV